ncbi:MAG: Phosphoesterase RecJ domain protein [Parcubacteria group bacterium GW2011_GWA2_53_21]|nr:MAG: Phosphoesterase RecJ domain protein [Parcubacteria group bacterium GW2011_GWA2_53_21]
MRLLSQKIHQHIKQASRVIVAPHQNPDGDAIGAATAFHEYLIGLNKDAVIFCVTPANEKLHFVPHSDKIITDPAIFNDLTFDTVVVVDSGDLRYNGIAPFVENTNRTIINIDHHATNEHYGHFNLVLPTAASTTEILYHYFRHNGIRINQKMATSLLTGLTTDTGNFTNAATSSAALNASGELIRSGGNMNLVTSETLKNKSIDALRLWGAVLGRLEKDLRTGITHTYLTLQDLEDYNVPDTESEGIANFLNNLEDNRIALILKELPGGLVKGNFRTTKDDVDVSVLAKKFNGGGHKKAAGFTADGTIEEVLKKIFSLL